MARETIKERAAQVERWLREHFPTPYPVVVRWAARIADDAYGECYWDSSISSIVIRLSRRRCRDRDLANSTLMHEWAHAVVMPNDRLYRSLDRRGAVQEHPDEFWLARGRIYRLFHDLDGHEESRRL